MADVIDSIIYHWVCPDCGFVIEEADWGVFDARQQMHSSSHIKVKAQELVLNRNKSNTNRRPRL